jgi:hypothetical protein
MRFALDEQGGFNIGAVFFSFGVLVDPHRDAVRHLFSQQVQGCFADEIGGNLALIQVGQLVGGKVRCALGEVGQDFVLQFFQAVAASGRDGQCQRQWHSRAIVCPVSFKLYFVHQINLVQRQDHRHRPLEPGQQFEQ